MITIPQVALGTFIACCIIYSCHYLYAAYLLRRMASVRPGRGDALYTQALAVEMLSRCMGTRATLDMHGAWSSQDEEVVTGLLALHDLGTRGLFGYGLRATSGVLTQQGMLAEAYRLAHPETAFWAYADGSDFELQRNLEGYAFSNVCAWYVIYESIEAVKADDFKYALATPVNCSNRMRDLTLTFRRYVYGTASRDQIPLAVAVWSSLTELDAFNEKVLDLGYASHSATDEVGVRITPLLVLYVWCNLRMKKFLRG